MRAAQANFSQATPGATISRREPRARSPRTSPGQLARDDAPRPPLPALLHSALARRPRDGRRRAIAPRVFNADHRRRNTIHHNARRREPVRRRVAAARRRPDGARRDVRLPDERVGLGGGGRRAARRGLRPLGERRRRRRRAAQHVRDPRGRRVEDLAAAPRAPRARARAPRRAERAAAARRRPRLHGRAAQGEAAREPNGARPPRRPRVRPRRVPLAAAAAGGSGQRPARPRRRALARGDVRGDRAGARGLRRRLGVRLDHARLQQHVLVLHRAAHARPRALARRDLDRRRGRRPRRRRLPGGDAARAECELVRRQLERWRDGRRRGQRSICGGAAGGGLQPDGAAADGEPPLRRPPRAARRRPP